MNTKLPGLKSNKEKLPFSFPGEVFYQDFKEERFQTCDSQIFIRPYFYAEASIPFQKESFHLPSHIDCGFLFYIKKGKGKLESDKESFELSAGSGLLAFTDCPLYVTTGEEPFSCLFFSIKGDLLWELYNVRKKNFIVFTGYQYPDFEQRLHSLLKEYLKAEYPLLFDFSRHMDHLLSRIIYQSIQDDRLPEKLKKQSLMRAVTYMKEHCRDQIRVGEIAAAFGYSSSHFSRIFQAEFHQSPKKYLIGLRIAQAEKLLDTSDFSIEDISQKCGFNTTTHFIQTFREKHHMTPLQYRKQSKPAEESSV